MPDPIRLPKLAASSAIAASFRETTTMSRHHSHTASCRSIARQLEEKLDTDLSPAARRLVRKHLAQCPNCTAYFDSLKKTVLLYQCYPDPRTPARLRQKLFAILKLHS